MAGPTGPAPPNVLRATGRRGLARPPRRTPPAHGRTACRPGAPRPGPARCGHSRARTSGCARWPPAAPEAAPPVPPPTRPPPCARAPGLRARAGDQASRQTPAPGSTAGCAGSPVRSAGRPRPLNRSGRPAPALMVSRHRPARWSRRRAGAAPPTAAGPTVAPRRVPARRAPERPSSDRPSRPGHWFPHPGTSPARAPAATQGSTGHRQSRH